MYSQERAERRTPEPPFSEEERDAQEVIGFPQKPSFPTVKTVPFFDREDASATAR